MAHYSGRTGNVYATTLLLDTCEAAWDSGANATASLEAGSALVKQGAGSMKCVTTGGANDDIMVYETMTLGAADIQTYTFMMMWARSTKDVVAADLRLGIGTTGAGANPTTLVDLPVLAADTWKFCHCPVVGGSPFSATSAGTILGLEYNANYQASTIYLDQIQAVAATSGIRNWTMDYTVDTVEVTDFANSGVAAYLPTVSRWGGTFDGLKDGIPLTIGAQIAIELGETSTGTQAWIGSAVLTGVTSNTAFDGVVTYSYTYQGTDIMMVPTA